MDNEETHFSHTVGIVENVENGVKYRRAITELGFDPRLSSFISINRPGHLAAVLN
jgi:hypothetical protein